MLILGLPALGVVVLFVALVFLFCRHKTRIQIYLVYAFVFGMAVPIYLLSVTAFFSLLCGPFVAFAIACLGVVGFTFAAEAVASWAALSLHDLLGHLVVVKRDSNDWQDAAWRERDMEREEDESGLRYDDPDARKTMLDNYNAQRYELAPWRGTLASVLLGTPLDAAHLLTEYVEETRRRLDIAHERATTR